MIMFASGFPGGSDGEESACNSPRETKYINIYIEREREGERERGRAQRSFRAVEIFCMIL